MTQERKDQVLGKTCYSAVVVIVNCTNSIADKVVNLDSPFRRQSCIYNIYIM